MHKYEEMKDFYKHQNLLVNVNHKKIDRQRKDNFKERINKKRKNFTDNKSSMEIKLENLSISSEILKSNEIIDVVIAKYLLKNQKIFTQLKLVT